jgi:hypothetical protein
MINCLIKNIPPGAKEPDGNDGIGFPLEGICPKPQTIPGYYCELLDEDGEPILLMDGQPILIECLNSPNYGPAPTPTPFAENNNIIVTAYYSSCPTTIEYSVATSFNVDADIDVCFENLLGISTGSPILTGACIRINKDEALGFAQLRAMVMFSDLSQVSTFQNVVVSAVSVSTSYSYPITFISVFENPGCYLAVEEGTAGIVPSDSITCEDGILLELGTAGVASFNIDSSCV